MSNKPADAGSEDPVAEAFAAIRAEAQRRTGRIPDLSVQAPRSGLKLNHAPATPRKHQKQENQLAWMVADYVALTTLSPWDLC